MSSPPEIPPFAQRFPPSKDLDLLVRAFVAGDYREVHRLADALEKSDVDSAVKAAAAEVRDRTNADPAVLGLIGMAAVLLVVLSAWWVVHAKPPAGAEPRPPVSLP